MKILVRAIPPHRQGSSVEHSLHCRMFPSFSESKLVPIILALLVTILLLVAKIKFILKMSKARTDVNVFNNSFALCLSASGCSENLG